MKGINKNFVIKWEWIYIMGIFMFIFFVILTLALPHLLPSCEERFDNMVIARRCICPDVWESVPLPNGSKIDVP